MEAVNAGFVFDDGKDVVVDVVKSPVLIRVPQAIDYSTARKRPQIIAALAAAFSAFLLGTTLGWSSPAQAQLQMLSSLDGNQNVSYWYIKLDDDQMSWVGSLLNIGALFGAISGGFLMDSFGRRFTLMTMSAPYIVGWLMITLAIDSRMLYIGRIVVGYSGGVCSAIAPCYIGEISTPTMRGIVGYFFSVNLASGVLSASLMGLWLEWRWMSAICTIEPILFLIGLFFVPESPYYLVKNGRPIDGVRALNWLRGSNYNIKCELHQIETRIENDTKETLRLADLSRSWIYKPVLIGVGLMLLQQFSGVNAAAFNAAEIFRLAELSYDRLIGVVLINTVQVMAVVLSSCLLVKRLNRRTLFITAEGLACLSMLALGAFFYCSHLDNSPAVDGLQWLPLTALIVFFAAVGLGLGPLPWLVSSEVLPAKFRGPGSSIVALTNFASSFIVTKTFVDMQRTMSHAGVFWFYSGISFTGMLFGLFVLPETKDQTSDQIQANFRTEMKS